MKKWTAVEYDVSKILAGVPAKHIKIPPNIKLQLVIELEDAAYAKLSKDPTWLQKMQEKANAKVNPVLETLKKKVAEMDAKASGFDAKTAGIFTNDINAFIKQKMEAAGPEMAKEIDKFFEEYKKGQKDLTTFRIKSGGKITLNAISIVGAVAVAGASHGALAPASIVGIVRASVTIAQECTKLALSADQIAKLIQGELAILKKIMIEDLEKAKKAGKVAQGVKEVGLNVLSGLLGVETPSLKNCKGHIDVHKVDIAKLESESHKLSEGIYKAMDVEEAWRKKFDAAKASMPANKVGKIVVQKEKAEKALHNMIEATIKVNEAVTRAEDRQKLFEKTIDAMMKGIPAWLGYVQEATSMLVDIGLSIGGASNVLEGALGVIQSAESDIGAILIDKA